MKVKKTCCLGCGTVLLACVAVTVSLMWYLSADEVDDRDMLPPGADDVVWYSSATFGSTMRCLRCRVNEGDLRAFAEAKGYRFERIDELNFTWTSVGAGIFDGLKPENRGGASFLHCVARDGSKRLRSRAYEGKLSFVYDIERKMLYSLYYD